METNSIFKQRFNTFFQFTLGEQQAHALALIEQFFKQKEGKHVFVLKGYAGTGKTSLVGALVQTLDSFKVKSKLLAPTGRAAKVFSQKAKKEAFTIHKQIYRRKSAVDDYTGVTRNENLHTNTLFFVDEASMIGEESVTKDGAIQRSLLEDLFEYVFSGKNCKLILIGDSAQLPPVGLDYSPALDVKFLAHHFPALHIHTTELTQVLRQEKDSGILFNATLLRDKVDLTFQFELKGYADISDVPGDEFLQQLEDAYSHVGMDEVLIVTRSNKRANLYNAHIRARILYYEEELCGGDRLMIVRNNYFWVDGNSKMGFIANGEMLSVRRVRRIEEEYGFRFARVSVSFVDYPEMDEIEVLLLLESLTIEGPSLSRDRMRELFFAVEKDYLHEKNKQKRYQLILKDPYFNALQVKYAYAITCHKSQGGQWQQVFIDPGYIPEEEYTLDFYRWLYTALTRSTDSIGLVNFDSKFFKT